MARFDNTIRTLPMFTEAGKWTPHEPLRAVGAGSGIVAMWMVAMGFVFFCIAVGAGSRIPFRIGAIGAALGTLCGLGCWGLVFTDLAIETEKVENKPMLPAPEIPTLPSTSRWTLIDKDGNQRRGEYGIPEDLLSAWCETGLDNGSLSFQSWVPWFGRAFAGEGRARFDEFRRRWIHDGHGKDRGGNVGLAFTDEGKRFARAWLSGQGRLAATTPPALLEDGEYFDGVGMHPHACTQETLDINEG